MHHSNTIRASLVLASVFALGFVGCGAPGSGGSEPGGSDEVLPPETIPDTIRVDEQDNLELIDDSAMQFRQTGASPIVVGDVLLSMENGGYIRRVDSVDQDADGSFLLNTSQAALIDAVQQGHFEASIDITPRMGDPSEKPQLNARLTADGYLDLSGLDLLNVPGLHVQVTSGHVSLGAAFDYDWDIDALPLPHLDSFEATLDGDLGFDIGVLVDASIATSYAEEFEVFRQTTPFSIGLVVLTIDFGLEVDASASGTVETGLTSDTSLLVGAYYDGDWHPIADRSTETDPHDLVWNLEGTVGARAYVRPKIEVQFFGVASPSFDLEPYVSFNGSVDPSCLYEWDLGVGVVADINFRVGVLDWTLAEYSTELFDWGVTVASDQGSCAPDDIRLSITVQGDGTVSLDPPGQMYDEGTVVQLTARPADGWYFDHWEGDISGSSPTRTVTMTVHREVVAVFEQVRPTDYVLTTSIIGSGTVSPTSGTYSEGTVVQLTASPSTGWFFDRWEGDVSGTSTTTTVIMTVDRDVVAVFEQGPDGDPVVICHIPPGNPGNAHTIIVNESAVPAHLAHGDTLGPCCTSGADCDDALFCNGIETCDVGTDGISTCVDGTLPCDPETETCDEDADVCDPGDEERILLDSDGSLNGQTVDASHYSITVAPGETISGTINIDVYNSQPSASVVPVAATVTWGDRESQVWTISSDLGAPGWYDLTVDVNKTAPTTEGTYYIVLGIAPHFTPAQVMSATSASCGTTAIWNDGNDRGWDWGPTEFDESRANGNATISIWTCSANDFVPSLRGSNWVGVHVVRGDCPTGWDEYNGHCYRLTEVVGQWSDAEAEAVEAGGHLVTINDGVENQWVFDTFAQPENVWIGLYQDLGDPDYNEPDGAWKWISGESLTYTNWVAGEPNDNGDEHWTEMKGAQSVWDSQWNDQGDVGSPLRGVIERE